MKQDLDIAMCELQEAYNQEMLLNGELAERNKELEEEIHFLLGVSNWDNITRNETDKLIFLYKKHKRMDEEGNVI